VLERPRAGPAEGTASRLAASSNPLCFAARPEDVASRSWASSQSLSRRRTVALISFSRELVGGLRSTNKLTANAAIEHPIAIPSPTLITTLQG